MDIQFYGANCVVLSNKQNRLIIDDNLASLNAKTVMRDGDVCLFTDTAHDPVTVKAKLMIDMPGEYEVSNVSVFGMQARAHMDEEGSRTAVIYKITWGEVRVLVTGHIFPKLNDDQLEQIGIVDIMLVPVGGNGYTTDAIGALQLIKAVEPKLVIPTHFAESALNYEVPQATLAEALQGLAMDPIETVSKFQFKPSDMTDTTQLLVLEATKP